ncbi:MAG: hypothetical protein AB7G21_06020 [Dehalococcoidia bacterium]
MPDPTRPAALAIVDPRLDLARVAADVAREIRPDLPIGVFAELNEGEAWVTKAEGPVLLLSDVSVMDDFALAEMREWAVPEGKVRLVTMFDGTQVFEEDRAREIAGDAVLMKPTRLGDWRAALPRYLGA